jgi:methyl-accepting chemotaxis protein
MAARRSTDGGNGNRARGTANGRLMTGIDPSLLRDEAGHITQAADNIARVAEAVSEGAAGQLRSLDDAVSGANRMVAALTETAGQAESVAASAEELVSTVNEMAASIEQVTKNTDSLAASTRETTSTIQQTEASVRGVTRAADEMATAAQQVTTSMNEMAALHRA